jgi:ABC-type branched-subunit amino acid transport system substrate-binding protein
MRPITTRAWLLLAAAVAVAASVTTASGFAGEVTESRPAPSPGVTSRTVVIGSDQPLTGLPAVGFGEIAPASRAFFDYVNARGGIGGRSIDYTYLDDANDPAKALADEQQLVSTDHVFAVFNGFGVVTHAAVVEFLNSHHVPDLFVGSSCACWNSPRQHPETFGFGTNYTLEARLIGAYVARSFATARIAYVWEQNPVGCCQQGVPELDREIPRSHVLAREAFTDTQLAHPPGLLPQVEAARAAGAQVLVLDTLAPAAVAEVLIDSARLNYHPTVVDPFPLSADPTTVGHVIAQLSAGQASPALEDGVITQAHLPSASDTSNPWIRLFRRIHDLYEPRAPFDNMTVYGMAAAYNFALALRHAGPHPTRESIVAAIDHGAVNSAGPGLIELDDSAKDHDGYTGAQIGHVSDGRLVLSGPVHRAGLTGPIAAVRALDDQPPSWLR